MEKEIKEIQRDLKKEILARLDQIEFKDALVRLANGEYTTDRSRKAALLATVVTDTLVSKEKRITATVATMRDNFENSHIGWYYEYGTGTLQKEAYPIAGFEGSPRNREKGSGVGSPIVTRSRFIDAGAWEDLGGNMRLSKARRAGNHDADFMKYIEGETKAHSWFRDSVAYISATMDQRLLKAVKSVAVSRYLHVKPVFTIGGKD